VAPSEQDEGWRELSALPGLAPGSEPDGSEVLTVEVDGETFALRPDEFGGTHYDWVSGPNPGYGFAASPTPPGWSLEQHRESIRSFLAQIDPATGYIAED
jgi:hypothetical protein